MIGSNDKIQLALKLQSYKQKIKCELLEFESQLLIATTIADQAMNKVVYLDEKRGMYKRMILHLGMQIVEMGNQMESDLKILQDNCNDTPPKANDTYELIGLATLNLDL